MPLLTSKLRRHLLQVVGAFFLPPMAFMGSACAKTAPTEVDRATFAAFLNVLLPKDKLTGSATDLKVDAKLWIFSEDSADFRRLITLGCQWLNMTGGAGFAALSAPQKITVVQWMSTSDWDQIPRRFYALARQTAIETYYSEPASWVGLPLQQPPQPEGYPPPWN